MVRMKTNGSPLDPETKDAASSLERENGLENKPLSSRVRLGVFVYVVGFVFTSTLSGHLGSFERGVHSFLPGSEPGEK